MYPSLNYQALVLAYDHHTPVAESLWEYYLQSEQLLAETRDLIPYALSLLAGQDPRAGATRHRFDALLSLAHDAGIEQIEASPLPAVIAGGCRRHALIEAFESIPTRHGELRPELVAQLLKYRLPLKTRRRYEADLFMGSPLFAMGPQLPPCYHTRRAAAAEHPDDPAYPPPPHRIYTPYVLHPFYLFLQRR